MACENGLAYYIIGWVINSSVQKGMKEIKVTQVCLIQMINPIERNSNPCFWDVYLLGWIY